MNQATLASLIDELRKLGDVDEMRLNPKPFKPLPAAPPAPFAVKHAFAVSSFSGVMNPGAFPQASSIPPWREPPIRKQSGPVGDSARLESTGEATAPNGRDQERKTAALSPSALARLGGAGYGAAIGAVAGRGLGGDEHGAGSTLKGALGGAALGAAAGHAVPRLRAGMASGMSFPQAGRAVVEDVGARARAALTPRAAAPPIPAPVSTAGLTAAGGARMAESYGRLPQHLRGALESTDLVRSGVPPHMAAQLAYMSRRGGESFPGSVARHALSGSMSVPKLVATPAISRDAKTVVEKAAAAPLTPAGRLESTQSVGAPRMSAPGPSIAQQSKPRGFGTSLPGLTKMALLERLIRLGATPIPGTPKLVMKTRSPQELAQLQHSVDDVWQRHVTKPILNRAEPALQKLPQGKLQDLARTGTKLVAEDPIGAAVTHAIPIPGAFAGYLAAKKGLEGAIDRVAPLHG